MYLCNIQNNGLNQLGVKVDNQIVNVPEALNTFKNESVPKNVSDLIDAGTDTLPLLQKFIDDLPKHEEASYILDEKDCTFGNPISSPEKIICVGLNYQQHADETKAPYPEVPILFSKFNNTLAAPNQQVAIPQETDQLDYEVELALIVGQKAKRIEKSKALDCLFGYSVANDLSARDLQMKTPQWLLGKTCDDFTPVGPYLATKDEINDVQNLELKTEVNGVIKQLSNTSDMIFSCEEIISYVSRYMTLMPGDIILTGTPEGVELGRSSEEQRYLREGDTVTVSVENIGKLTNSFYKEG